jgi:diketogulonate reductase-like aldo/keto reductase
MNAGSSVKLSNGGSMPVIGLGTWQIEGERCTKAVKAALDLGYRHIDTAKMYGNETEIGQAIRGFPREQLFITTKVWNTDLGYDDTIASCDDSLAQLDTAYLDLLLIHWPNRNIPLAETFRAFKRLVDEKKVRAVGVSNFTIARTEEALAAADKLGLTIAVNQVEFHPFLYQKELLEFCRQHNIQLVAYSPLARGMVMRDKTIAEIAKRHGKTPGQVSLRWILDKGVVVIPKASSKEHLAENLDLDFKLTPDETAALDKLPQQRLVAPGFAEF